MGQENYGKWCGEKIVGTSHVVQRTVPEAFFVNGHCCLAAE
jgi:hypothetical protein